MLETIGGVFINATGLAMMGYLFYWLGKEAFYPALRDVFSDRLEISGIKSEIAREIDSPEMGRLEEINLTHEKLVTELASLTEKNEIARETLRQAVPELASGQMGVKEYLDKARQEGIFEKGESDVVLPKEVVCEEKTLGR